MWKLRNECEHNQEGLSMDIKKKKEIEQIMWLIKHIEEQNTSHPFKNLTQEKAQKYPIMNLQMINRQLQTLHESNKEKNKNRTKITKSNVAQQKHIGNKTSKNQIVLLSQTAQAISHISTQVVGPHFGVD
jgi:hypothetical protein